MLPPCFRPLFTHLAVSQTWEHEWQSPGDCSLQRKVPKVYIWTSVSFCSFALHPCRPITLQRMFHYRFPLTNSCISHSEKKKKRERASTLQDKTPTDQSSQRGQNNQSHSYLFQVEMTFMWSRRESKVDISLLPHHTPSRSFLPILFQTGAKKCLNGGKPDCGTDSGKWRRTFSISINMIWVKFKALWFWSWHNGHADKKVTTLPTVARRKWRLRVTQPHCLAFLPLLGCFMTYCVTL